MSLFWYMYIKVLPQDLPDPGRFLLCELPPSATIVVNSAVRKEQEDRSSQCQQKREPYSKFDTEWYMYKYVTWICHSGKGVSIKQEEFLVSFRVVQT